jgi:DNA modification methylase
VSSGDRPFRPRRQSDRSGGPAPSRGPRPGERPPLRIFTTTLWEYPSQHYDAYVDDDGKVIRSKLAMQGDSAYVGATPSWVIWQLLARYTRPNDLIVDPMCGSGTTIDVARDFGRRGMGYDLAPSRPDIFRADARKLPLEAGVADFAFVDPPYSTHIDYSDDPACIGKLDSGASDGGRVGGAYYDAMEQVIRELHRVLKNRRYMGLYVSDSWKKKGSRDQGSTGSGAEGQRGHGLHDRGDAGSGTGFMPIGFELFSIMRRYFQPVDIICVVRKNAKLEKGNWHKAAAERNFFLRGFNYLFIMKKVDGGAQPVAEKGRGIKGRTG